MNILWHIQVRFFSPRVGVKKGLIKERLWLARHNDRGNSSSNHEDWILEAVASIRAMARYTW